MPFDLTNAPVTFQSLMNAIFQPFLCRFFVVFFDDILVYSTSLEEHEKQFQEVLSILKHHQFFVNGKMLVWKASSRVLRP